MGASPAPPAEILLQILSHIPPTDRSTFIACLRSFKGFYNVASLKLYRTIRISSYSPSSPLYDAHPSPPIAKGALAKHRVGGGKAVRSRKAQLLDKVRVLEVDGRKDGPFAGVKAVVLPRVRTLVVDVSLTKALEKRGEGKEWVDAGHASERNAFENLSGVKPSTIVLKHLGFHESTDLLADLPLSALSQVKRLVYLVDYTSWDSDFFGRTYGPSHSVTSFGLHQWLDGLADSPKSLVTVDIVFWTSLPGLNFSAPRNKYTYQRLRPGETWLDRYVTHIAEAFPNPGKVQFNFVNAGSFDRHAIRAAEWEYGKAQEVFREKLLAELGPTKEGKKGYEEVVRCVSVVEWLEGLRKGGVDEKDILSEEELAPWVESVVAGG